MAAYVEPVQVHMPIGHFADLCRFRPDVVISAEFGLRSLIATAYARLFRAKFLLACEATGHTSRDCTAGQRLLRRFLAPPPRLPLQWPRVTALPRGIGRAAARHLRDRPGP